jgi:hypothetical protein
MSIPQHLQDELDARALRHALWLALHSAQRCGLAELTGRLTAMLLEADQFLAHDMDVAA